MKKIKLTRLEIAGLILWLEGEREDCPFVDDLMGMPIRTSDYRVCKKVCFRLFPECYGQTCPCNVYIRRDVVRTAKKLLKEQSL